MVCTIPWLTACSEEAKVAARPNYAPSNSPNNPPINPRFSLQSIAPSEDNISLDGTFLFENKSDSPIAVPGLFGLSPVNRVFRPHYVEFEVFRGGKWTRLDVSYDGITEYYAIEPAVQYQFVITLGPYYREQTPIQCRILLTHYDPNGKAVATYTSDPFTMDKVKPDRKE
jgi:hypothetical protein